MKGATNRCAWPKMCIRDRGDAENAGAQCVFHTPLVSGRVRPEGGFDLQFGGDDAMSLSCNVLINSAGLQAPALARRIDGVPAASIPTDYPVSYTHLDVYKRQALVRDDLAVADLDDALRVPRHVHVVRDQDDGCLLYTSRCV